MQEIRVRFAPSPTGKVHIGNIRAAVSGRGEGIGLFEMLQLLGKEKTLARLKAAAEKYCP